MMTRPFVIATLGSLLFTTPTAADRRRRGDDDSRRSIGRTEREDRRAKDTDDDQDDRRKSDRKRDRDDRDDRKRDRRETVAQRVERDDDSDGPEAQATLAVKLDDLIETAVQLAPELARSKTDRAVARGQAGASRREQSWILGAEANYSINAVSREVEVAPFQPVREDTAKGALSLGRKLPTGGTFGVEVGMTRKGSEISIPQEYLDVVQAGMTPTTTPPGQNQEGVVKDYYTTHQAIAKLTLTQPLARGFGPSVALAPEKRADLVATEATIKTQLAAEDMILGIVTGYWELAYLNYESDVRAEALELAVNQEKITREQIRAGTVPTTAANAVTYEIAVRSEAKLRIELEVEKKSLELRKRVGLELGRREIALRPGDAFEIGKDEWDVNEVLARSRKSNRRLAAIAVQRRVAEVEMDVAKNGMLPQVDVELSGGILGTGQSQDEAFSGVGAANGYQVMAGLKVSFELSGAAKAAHEAARAKRARTEVDRADESRTIDTQVVSAAKAVTSARARVGLSDKAINVAEENVTAERQSFAAGRSDNFKVMQRQSELIEARLRRGRAVAEYHIAVAQLQQLSGLLLEQYSVNVRPNGK